MGPRTTRNRRPRKPGRTPARLPSRPARGGSLSTKAVIAGSSSAHRPQRSNTGVRRRKEDQAAAFLSLAPSPVLAASRISPIFADSPPGKREVVVCYMNAPVPYAIEENFGGCFFEDDVDLAQVLQDQEIVYQLIQGNDGSSSSRTHPDPSSSCGHQWALDERQSSGAANYESQIAVDEALARELQEIEDQIANTSVVDNNITEGRKPITSSASKNGNTSASRSPQVVMEDGIDPDNMTYEELQQLGDAIGTESKGLPEHVIALLPCSTYKIGIFSRKEKHDECVICCMAYKNRDRMTKLPCEHQYHQTCVTKWLKINKVCPVCNKEVFGS